MCDHMLRRYCAFPIITNLHLSWWLLCVSHTNFHAYEHDWWSSFASGSTLMFTEPAFHVYIVKYQALLSVSSPCSCVVKITLLDCGQTYRFPHLSPLQITWTCIKLWDGGGMGWGVTSAFFSRKHSFRSCCEWIPRSFLWPKGYLPP